MSGARHNIGPTALYRHYDSKGGLLYVGISLSVIVRTMTHRSTSHWYHRVARIDIEQLPTMEAALEAERVAILKENPRYNIRGKNYIPTSQGSTQDKAKTTLLARDIAKEVGVDPLRVLITIAGDEKNQRDVRIAAAETAYPYLYPKPATREAVDGLVDDLAEWTKPKTQAEGALNRAKSP